MKLKILRFFFYVIGGFHSTRNLPKEIKITLLYFYIFSLAFVDVFGVFGFIITSVETDSLTIAILFGTVDGTMTVALMLFVTHLYHNEWEILLTYIEKNNSTHSKSNGRTSTSIYIEKYNSVKVCAVWIFLAECGALPYVLIGLFDLLFVCEGESFRELKHHLLAFPFLNQIPSFNVAICLYMAEIIVFVVGTGVGFSQPVLIMMAASELNNIVVDYCEGMRSISTYIDHEAIHGRKMSERGLHIFERKFVSTVRKYQKFVKIVRMIQPYVEITITLELMIIFVGLLVHSYSALFADLETVVKLRHMSLCLIFCVYFFSHCIFGHQFNVINETIKYEVYNLPWYTLPPEQRKLVCTFLCEVQRPIEFKAFRVYPIDLQTFPRILKAAYSYVSVLHRAITTDHFSGHIG